MVVSGLGHVGFHPETRHFRKCHEEYGTNSESEGSVFIMFVFKVWFSSSESNTNAWWSGGLKYFQ